MSVSQFLIFGHVHVGLLDLVTAFDTIAVKPLELVHANGRRGDGRPRLQKATVSCAACSAHEQEKELGILDATEHAERASS